MHTYICNEKRNLTVYDIFIYILTVSVQTWSGLEQCPGPGWSMHSTQVYGSGSVGLTLSGVSNSTLVGLICQRSMLYYSSK